MIDPNQQTRYWADTAFQLIKDGLAQPILGAYKRKFNPTNYMGVIRDSLRSYHNGAELDPSVFTSEDLLIQNADLSIWLHLMLRGWDIFLPKFGKNGKRRVEQLRDLRNKWAHPKSSDPITTDETRATVEIGVFLMDAFQCEETAKHLREIQAAISQPPPIPFNSNGSMKPAVEPTDNTWLAEDSNVATERIQPLVMDDTLCLEIVERNGETRYEKIPLQNGRSIVGRGQSAHIHLNDVKVSRVHLMLMKNSLGLILTDLYSANGTCLENQVVKANEAVHWEVGQKVVVGDTWLILRRGALV